MADKNGVILQLYSRARAPNRDYYGLTISNADVTLNTWNITHGPHVFPKKQRCSLEDVQIAKSFLSEVHRLFGLHVVNYCLALGRGDARLECLPTKVFLKILRNLASNDILKLGQSSKIFFELCNRNDVWGIIFAKRNKAPPTRDEIKQAEQKGWKIIIRNKLIWSNKVNSKKSKTVKSKSEVTNTKVVDPPVVKNAEVKKLPFKVAPPKIEKTSVKSTTKHIQNIAKPTILQPKIESANFINAISAVTNREPVIPTNALKDVPKTDNNSLHTRSFSAIPRKGILKKSNHSMNNSQTESLTSYVPLDAIPEKPDFMTTINCQPMTHEELKSLAGARLNRTTRINSLLNGLHMPKELSPTAIQSAKDRRLDRFLSDLDSRTAINPYQIGKKLLEQPSKSIISTADSKTKKPSIKLEDKPFIKDFLSTLKSEEKFSTSGKMTSKFEDYITPLKGNTTDKNMTKSNIMPKISELTRSINELRSSFYSTDKLKIKVGSNLNNTKVANQNGRSQQLNNKLNNVVPKSPSASNIVMKRNSLKPQSKSVVSTLPVKPVKVKNTNCATASTPAAKPANASKMATNNVSAIHNVRKF